MAARVCAELRVRSGLDLEARYRGDTGEMQGRYTADIRQIYGRYTADIGELRARSGLDIEVRVTVKGQG